MAKTKKNREIPDELFDQLQEMINDSSELTDSDGLMRQLMGGTSELTRPSSESPTIP